MNQDRTTSFRYDDKTDEMLQEIIYYLQTQTMGVYIKRSDAIRYAIESAAIRIRHERQAGPPRTFDGNEIQEQWKSPE